MNVEQGTTTTGGTQPALYQELGHITRQLHDSLGRLGVMPGLQAAAQGLPDARSRLNYVADKTAAAAHRVLNAVEAAKSEHRRLEEDAQALRRRLEQAAALAGSQAMVPAAAVAALLASWESSSRQLDAHLTDIMLAQDFHDLTGQVVRRVLEVATTLEDSLVQLLVQSAPADTHPATSPEATAAAHEATPSAGLQGPVVAGTQQGEVLNSQGEVDDLLASLGF